MKDITTYSEFWPYYLREHSQPSTRGWHYVGTCAALFMLTALLVTGKWMFLPLIFVSGYFFAWMSHGLIEKNKPATFTYPLWSLISDFKMFFCFITGQMADELLKAGVTPSSNSGAAE